MGEGPLWEYFRVRKGGVQADGIVFFFLGLMVFGCFFRGKGGRVGERWERVCYVGAWKGGRWLGRDY